MTDSILSGILTFGLLIGGSLAIASEMAPAPRQASVVAAVELPAVTVTGHRQGTGAPAIVVASAR